MVGIEGEKKVWFKAKRFGYGWYPATWQGKVIVLAYIILLILALITFPDNALILFIICAVLTTALFLISKHTGEPARWRWK